ncbi:DUF6443 domain-containing protein [Chondrinema litorale]|uniref:DUF6443 domain-containing protein n=1 Tax=Chondrinema litorale TaxID=2994555 RepID=UPI0025430260|nr:DUF6443 domain-containing protein [Chondrinema litorale]UZR97145.1 DUF6443 domain-containing protein [Chondrinema litorale]
MTKLTSKRKQFFSLLLYLCLIFYNSTAVGQTINAISPSSLEGCGDTQTYYFYEDTDKTDGDYTLSLSWAVVPVSAGTISGSGLSVTVTWDSDYEGDASLVAYYTYVYNGGNAGDEGEGEGESGGNIDGTATSTYTSQTDPGDISAGNSTLAYNSSTTLTVTNASSAVIIQQKTTSGWSDLTSTTSNNVTTATSSSLTQDTQFRSVLTNACGTFYSDQITVTVYPEFDAGTIQASSTSVCNGVTSIDIIGSPATGGNGTISYDWWVYNGTSWDIYTGDGEDVEEIDYELEDITFGNYQKIRRRAWSQLGETNKYSNEIDLTAIEVGEALAAGSISAETSICSGTAPGTLTLQGTSGGGGGYTYVWMFSTDEGVNWSSQSGGTTYNYSSTISEPLYVKVKVTSDCGFTESTDEIVINTYTESAGDISEANSKLEITQGEAISLTVTGNTGTVTYQKCTSGCSSTSDVGWMSTSATISNLTETSNFRTKLTSSCGTFYSDQITVTVYEALDPGSIQTTSSVCYGESSIDITGTPATGGKGTISYQWEVYNGTNWDIYTGDGEDIDTNVAELVDFPFENYQKIQRRAWSQLGETEVYTDEIDLTTIVVGEDLVPGTISAISPVCLGTAPGTLSLQGTSGGGGGYSYNWMFGTEEGETINWEQGEESKNGASTYEYTSTILAPLYVKVSVGSDCGFTESTTEILIDIYNDTESAGTVSSSVPENICYGENITLVVEDNTGEITWEQYDSDDDEWDTITGSTITNLTETTIFRAKLDTYTCSEKYSEEFTINVYPEITTPSLTASNSTVCLGSEVTLTASSSNASSYLWYEDGDLIAETTSGEYTITSILSTALYSVTVTNDIECESTESDITITVQDNQYTPETPTLIYNQASQDYTLGLNNEANAEYDYYWQYYNPESEETPDYEDTSHSEGTRTLTAPGYYYVRARSNTTGCWGPLSKVVVIHDHTTPTAYDATQTDFNYVRTFTFQTATTKNTNIASILDDDDALYQYQQPDEMMAATQYLDGLGRPIQQVAQMAGVEKNGVIPDIIQPIFYDDFGRENTTYLPYTTDGGSTAGDIRMDSFAEQKAFYSDNSNQVADSDFPFSYTEYENSPLNRVLRQAGPGESWVPTLGTTSGDHSVKFSYRTNTDVDAVRLWEIGTDLDELPLNDSETYDSGELYVTETVDEEDGKTIEFKNKSGQVVLIRVYLETDESGEEVYLDTYYIYDDFGNLRFVLPPKAVEAVTANSWIISTAIADELCFSYAYDARQRMIQKQVPGAKPVEMVYDQLDRLVLSRDGNQKENEEWLFTMYDKFSRPAVTGIYYSSDSRSDLQDEVDELGVSNVVRDDNVVDVSSDPSKLVVTTDEYTQDLYASKQITLTAPFNFKAGEDGDTFIAQIVAPTASEVDELGYTSSSGAIFPSENYDVLTISYYDDYSFTDQSFESKTDNIFTDANVPLSTAEKVGHSNTSNVKGMLTGSVVRVLETDQWLTTVSFYDEWDRVIQTVTDNQEGGKDRLSTYYDFAGKSRATYLEHTNPNGENYTEMTILNRYEMDHAGRITKSEQKINDGLWEVLSQSEYNEMSELATKTMAPENADLIQYIDYSYNIRGWLTGINDVTDTDLADEKLFAQKLYYNDANTGYEAYNGNIGTIEWKTGGDQEIRGYDYSYDQINRLVQANYIAPSGSEENYSVDLIDYDANGNILSLQRNGPQYDESDGSLTEYGLIDNLTYTYEQSGISNKLMQVDDTDSYYHAKNGDFKDISGTDYDYDDNGNLILDNNKGITSIEYNHLNLPKHIVFDTGNELYYSYDAAGIKLEKIAVGTEITSKTTYIGGMVYENDILQFIHTEEGRVLTAEALDTDATQDEFVYEYHYKDHLGNLRLSLRGGTEITYTATLEYDNVETESALFENITETIDATNGGYNSSNASYLVSGGSSNTVGPLKVIQVNKGDKISASAYARYETSESYNQTVYASGEYLANSGEQVAIGNNLLGLNPVGSSSGEDDIPYAYLRIVIYDTEGNELTEQGYVTFVESGETNWFTLNAPFGNPSEITIEQEGTAVIYVANESDIDVWFDDVEVNYTPARIVQENHYYPYGMNLAGIEKQGIPDHKYQYNGKEKQEEFGLNWMDYGARMYDAQIGRWHMVDPLSNLDYNLNSYNFTMNNPILLTDPTGLSTHVKMREDGTYQVVKGGVANDKDLNIYVIVYDEDGNAYNTGISIGESITSHSFFDENEEAVVDAVIDLNSTEGQDFLDDEIIEPDLNLIEYMPNATRNKPLDFKRRNINKRPKDNTEKQYMYRGSVNEDGKIGSARDFGNIAAGIVASRNGLAWGVSRLGLDGLETFQSKEKHFSNRHGTSYMAYSIKTEATVTQLAQKEGFRIGTILRGQDTIKRGSRR